MCLDVAVPACLFRGNHFSCARLQVSDKRRVVMRWRLGSRLPNKGLVRHQLAAFGQVSEDNIAIDHEKAVVEVQFGAAVEAAAALVALNRKAETMFSVKQVGGGRAVAGASPAADGVGGRGGGTK